MSKRKLTPREERQIDILNQMFELLTSHQTARHKRYPVRMRKKVRKTAISAITTSS